MSESRKPRTPKAASKTKPSATVWIVRGVEGLAVYINNHRVAGPKPWGGGTSINEWTVDRELIEEALGNE